MLEISKGEKRMYFNPYFTKGHHHYQPYRYELMHHQHPHHIQYAHHPFSHYYRPFRSENDSNFPLRDYGPYPFVINIEEATTENETFRTALWTGTKFQVTLMSIGVGEDIGLERHPDVDQFLRIEQGQGIVQMGENPNHFTFEREVFDDYAIVIPAGTWHNVTNTGNVPLKLYSIYAPPNHPLGTGHATKEEAMAAEEHHS